MRYPKLGEEPAPEHFFEELRPCRDDTALIDLAQCSEWGYTVMTRITPLIGNQLQSMLSSWNGMAASKHAMAERL